MTARGRGWPSSFGMTFLALIASVRAGTAADLTVPPPSPAFQPHAVAPGGSSYRFTLYVWLPSTNGTSTVLGRATDIDASFIDVVEHAQIPKDLFAVMG